MELILLAFLPVFIHELGHYATSFVVTGKKLTFTFSKGSVFGIPIPRWIWSYPVDATDTQMRLIAQAGFGFELALTCVLPWPYGVVALCHFLLYPWYAGESNDFKKF